MEALRQFLSKHANDGLLPWAGQVAVTQHFGLSHADVEDAALQAGLLPARYQRNRNTFTIENQRTLLHSRVVVVGCGGLGGYILEELARIGIGNLVAVDPDVFEEHNVNLLLFSTLMTVGSPKVFAAAKRIAEINPAVKVIPIPAPYKPENATKLFDDTDVVVDALDSIPTRLALAASCKELSLPLVHGAIAGWYGQVTTQFPGEGTLTQLYGGAKEVKGVEQTLGNPAFSPALVASIEVAEVCKVLLKIGEPLRNRVLVIDLLTMSFDVINMRLDSNSATDENAGVVALATSKSQ